MTSKLSTYLKKSDEPQQPQRSPIECMADGCPLPGSYRITNSTSVCRVHDAALAHRWPLLTERIRRRERAFAAAREMLNATPQSDPDIRIENAFVKTFGDVAARKKKFYGFAEQKPPARGLEFETARDYAARMLSMLEREALGEPTEIPPEAAKIFEDMRSTVHTGGESHADAN